MYGSREQSERLSIFLYYYPTSSNEHILAIIAEEVFNWVLKSKDVNWTKRKPSGGQASQKEERGNPNHGQQTHDPLSPPCISGQAPSEESQILPAQQE